MNNKIDVLDIQIDDYTAKEGMQKAIEFLQTELISVVELVTAELVIQAGEIPELKEYIGQSDMVLAGDRALLEAAEVTSRKSLQEADNHLFLRMFMRYMHKGHNRVFLLGDTKEELEQLVSYIETYYNGIQIVGTMAVPQEGLADDMIINHINGAEVDCILAAISSPEQEAFVMRNRLVLNARVWLGLGKSIRPFHKLGTKGRFMKDFLTKRIFKKEVEKEKRKKERDAAMPTPAL